MHIEQNMTLRQMFARWHGYNELIERLYQRLGWQDDTHDSQLKEHLATFLGYGAIIEAEEMRFDNDKLDEFIDWLKGRLEIEDIEKAPALAGERTGA